MKLTAKLRAPLCLILTGAFLTFPAQAHHSIVGEFDTSIELEVRGTVTKVEWFNPHIWLTLDVTSENGTIEEWDCEMGSPNQLIRAGWKKDDLPIGTTIRAQANPSRDGTNTCTTRTITLDDGTPVFSRFGRN